MIFAGLDESILKVTQQVAVIFKDIESNMSTWVSCGQEPEYLYDYVFPAAQDCAKEDVTAYLAADLLVQAFKKSSALGYKEMIIKEMAETLPIEGGHRMNAFLDILDDVQEHTFLDSELSNQLCTSIVAQKGVGEVIGRELAIASQGDNRRNAFKAAGSRVLVQQADKLLAPETEDHHAIRKALNLLVRAIDVAPESGSFVIGDIYKLASWAVQLPFADEASFFLGKAFDFAEGDIGIECTVDAQCIKLANRQEEFTPPLKFVALQP